MATVIRDTIIVTCDADGRIEYNSAIAVGDDGNIAAIGSNDEVAQAYPTAEVISGRGKAVFPGFFNCHTHLTATLSRGILEDLGFPSPLRFPEQVSAMLSAEEMQVMAVLGAIEGIRSGTTTFFEQGRGVSTYAQHLADTGARFVLGESMIDVTYNVISAGTLLKSSSDFSEELAEAAYQRAVDAYESWHGKADGRLTVYFAPSTTDSVSPAMLRRSRELAEERGVGYTIHLSQSKQEVAGVMAAWGVLPAHYLEQNEFLGPRLVVAHCREIIESEIRALGRHGTGVSNNPAIAARRGAAAPSLDLEEAGCQIGIIDDTATSVRLLKVLLDYWHGAKSQTRFGSIGAGNDAVLLIGDTALQNARASDEHPKVIDLADEWKKATGLPFVFARWYAASGVSEADRESVAGYFDKNLTFNLSDPSCIHRRRTDPGLSLEQTGCYIRNFIYRLGDVELEGLRRFRELDSELQQKVSAA